MERTEHFDWNDGWAFTPQFTPALLEAAYDGPRWSRSACPTPSKRCLSITATKTITSWSADTGVCSLRPKAGRAASCC